MLKTDDSNQLQIDPVKAARRWRAMRRMAVALGLCIGAVAAMALGHGKLHLIAVVAVVCGTLAFFHGLFQAVLPVYTRPWVVVANRADGGIFYWLGKLYGFAAVVGVVVGTLCCTLLYSYFSLHTPAMRDLRAYAHAVPAVSRIYAADGTLLGEFAREWREFASYDQMPDKLVNAFLAVEDHDYFHHGGIYWRGIARAAWRNVTAGDFAQGGSTITQQVAKQFLGAEKSLSRKAKEAITARRLEATYSKQAILAVYLNQIYLGDGAWGVAAAARRYFQKELKDLTLAECALIAGLAKAPTLYSPIHRPKLAVERRNLVLDKMADNGFASAAEVAAAKQEPIHLDLYREVFPDRMPYYAEQVRRYMTDKYGNDALFEDGLRIETAADPAWEAAAYDNADFGARHQDKRQGWRGPEWRLDGAARATFIARQKQLYGTGPLQPGRRYLALVDKVGDDKVDLLVGDHKLKLPLANMSWAAKWQNGNADNDQTIENAHDAVKPGYAVWVTREIRSVPKFRDWNMPDKTNPTWLPRDDQHEWDDAHADVVKLEQVPHPQTTIFTADHHTGYVVSMVGGFDYDRSVFNRAVQACRQPGSTYKPIYYSLGLDQGYGFDTVLDDVPVEITDPDTGETWTPTNLGETWDNAVTLEYALVFSKNVPSVDLFRKLGAKNVVEWARKLGFTTKIFADDALALGASCSKMDEMARAFTVFARGGNWWPRPDGHEKDWIYVRRIVDRLGNTLEDNTVAEDAELAAGDRYDRLAALAGVEAPRVIAPRTAFLMTRLLAEEVQFGFANVLRQTGINAAGKTGTSSATHDNLFIAYTSRFTTLVWMGDDKKERALGKSDAAYMTVVPLWSRYMYEAAKNYPNPTIPWNVPPGVKNDDRGDHSKGKKADEPMELIFKPAKKKSDKTTDNRPPV
jgi:penicillin-binding protein 1A